MHKNIGALFSLLPKDVRIKRKLKQGIKFLDIGCGRGGLILKLAQEYQNSSFTGIDPIPFGIEAAKKEISKLGLDARVKAECLGCQELPYKDEFDIALILITLHEISPKVREKGLEKINQALKNDGILVIIDFSYPELERIEDFKNPKYERGILDQFRETCTGSVLLSANGQNELLRKAGFNTIKRNEFQGLDLIAAMR